LHEVPKRNKADFGGRQQIIFQAIGECAGFRIPAHHFSPGFKDSNMASHKWPQHP
jgi:hypothetical protein